MNRMIVLTAAGLVATSIAGGAAMADPGDFANKRWEKRVDCEKKLHEARSRHEFQKQAAECDRDLAKLGWEQRKEAAKAWREAEKTWREQAREDRGDDWDD